MKRKTFVFALLFVVCFFAILFYWLAEYLHRFFGTSDLEAVFFHLKFPVLNAGNTVIFNFLQTVLLPSVIFSVAIFASPAIIRHLLQLRFKEKFLQRAFLFFFAAVLCALWQMWFYLPPIAFFVIALISFFWADIVLFFQHKKIAHRAALFLHLLLIFGVIAFCGNAVSNRFNVTEFVKSQYDFSSFYEKNYIAFDDSVLKDFVPQQNLVVIFAESMTPAIHWALNIPTPKQEIALRFEDPALPNLHRFLRENWFFEAKNEEGGGGILVTAV